MGVASVLVPHTCTEYSQLTTEDFVNVARYTVLLSPLGVSPPNNTALLSVTDVRVKLLQGGGLSPVTAGEIH